MLRSTCGLSNHMSGISAENGWMDVSFIHVNEDFLSTHSHDLALSENRWWPLTQSSWIGGIQGHLVSQECLSQPISVNSHMQLQQPHLFRLYCCTLQERINVPCLSNVEPRKAEKRLWKMRWEDEIQNEQKSSFQGWSSLMSAVVPHFQLCYVCLGIIVFLNTWLFQSFNHLSKTVAGLDDSDQTRNHQGSMKNSINWKRQEHQRQGVPVKEHQSFVYNVFRM